MSTYMESIDCGGEITREYASELTLRGENKFRIPDSNLTPLERNKRGIEQLKEKEKQLHRMLLLLNNEQKRLLSGEQEFTILQAEDYSR